MTIQIGMIGTDGIVIASDTRWMHTPRTITLNEPYPRQTFDASKIVTDYPRGIAISCAKNMETARLIADRFLEELKDDDARNPDFSPIWPIEELCSQTYEAHRQGQA